MVMAVFVGNVEVMSVIPGAALWSGRTMCGNPARQHRHEAKSDRRDQKRGRIPGLEIGQQRRRKLTTDDGKAESERRANRQQLRGVADDHPHDGGAIGAERHPAGQRAG